MERKSLKDLTLLDRFLFAEAMEDPETMQILLEIILGEQKRSRENLPGTGISVWMCGRKTRMTGFMTRKCSGVIREICLREAGITKG